MIAETWDGKYSVQNIEYSAQNAARRMRHRSACRNEPLRRQSGFASLCPSVFAGDSYSEIRALCSQERRTETCDQGHE